MLEEFKRFLLRGNVMDLAVGVIIGGAFNAIVTSLVNDIVTPLLSIFTGKIDFSSLAFTIPYTAATIKFGSFLTAVINFVIMGFVIFVMVKAINKITEPKAKPEMEPEPETTKICPYCKSEIHIDAKRCPNCTSELETEQ